MRHFFLTIISSFLLFQATVAQEDEKPLSYFLIGNSLTWDTVPSKLDGDTQWHVDCGKSLPFMYENPEEPCVKTSTLWPQALEEKQYDFLSLQVHYGSTLLEDAAVISALLDLQKEAKVIIHTGWARSASREEEYMSDDVEGKMVHSPAYFEALLEKLRELYPDREFQLTHTQDLLALIAEDIEAGKAPIGEIQELYRDDIHMNVVTGRYMMHNAMRQALGQPRSDVGFEKLAPSMKKYLDSVLDRYFEKKESK